MCPSAGLELFLDLEKSRPPVPDGQHIYNKLLFDAVNQELARCLHEVSQFGSLAQLAACIHLPAFSQCGMIAQLIVVRHSAVAEIACESPQAT